MKMNKGTIEDLYLLSPMQQGMLFHTLYTTRSAAYFEQSGYTLRGEFDATAFKQAWQRVVARHAVLRTQFVWNNVEKPLQVIRNRVNLPWSEYDWRNVPEPQQQARLQELLESDRRQGFHLDRAPLFRVTLIRLSDNATHFVWSFHHILLDGWSSALLLEELFAFYESYRRGEPLEMDVPRLYRDYIAWLYEQDQGRAEHFWRKTLAGFTAPTILEVDRMAGKKHEQVFTYGRQQVAFSEEATAVLKNFARQHQLTFNTLIQGAWALLLSRYSGNENVIFGAVVSGRPENLRGSESTIGLFINTIPVCARISPRQRLLPWLKELQTQQLEAHQFEYNSLIDIQGWSQIPGNLPLFENILVFENYPGDDRALEQRLSLKIEATYAGEHTNYPLVLGVVPQKTLELYLIYDTHRFDADIIQRMLGQLQEILQSLLIDPMQLIGCISLLSKVEQQKMLREWNQTAVPLAGPLTLPDLFEKQVEHTPDAIALVYKNEQFTYQQINVQANRLAYELQKRGIGPDVLVGLCCHRSPMMIIALLGILKAGGAYLPLDPVYPRERLEFMIRDARLPFVLAQESLQATFSQIPCSFISIEACLQAGECATGLNPSRNLLPSHAAYVIYTSGSTGIPKGAMMCHRSICSLLRTQIDILEVEPGSRVLQFASCSFDASVWDIMSPLTTGGMLYMDTRDALMPGMALCELIDQQAITLAALTPSVLAVLPDVPLPTLRTLIVSGEPCAAELVGRWSQGRKLHNAYGPTETTVYSTIALNLCSDEPPLVGRPVANTRIYLLDANFQSVPVGVTGEIFIGGDGLARGYLHRPELTAERFLPDPFCLEPGARLYKTGDLARYAPDGQIEFLKRNDHQIKIRGFRVEPVEIEAALSRFPAVQRCVVTAYEDGNDQLIAYVLSSREQQLSPQILRNYLQEKLPFYMIPDIFVILTEFPLTPNGKVDLPKLLAEPRNNAVSTSQTQPPRDFLETQLLQAYEEVLQVRPIGITDDFFLLGGHSLSAVRLMGAIQKRLEVTIALPMLFQATTVAQLAERLRQQQHAPLKKTSPSSLVALRDQGKSRPLFCVHPASGYIMCYQTLAQYLSLDQPVYGLQDPDVYAQAVTRRSIEEIASSYLAEIRQVQPEGPYLLVGYSFGCVVAFEMAQQLRRAEQDIALLALIDGNSPALAGTISTEHASLLTVILMEIIHGKTKKSEHEIHQELQLLTPVQQLSHARDVLKEHTIDPSYTDPQWLGHMVQLFKCRMQAVQEYRPGIYDRRITAFISDQIETPVHIAHGVHHAKDLGWHNYSTHPIDLHLLPGTHADLMREPFIQTLAIQLQTCLGQIERSNDFVQL